MQRGDASSRPDRWLVRTALFFVVAWLLTFNGAYVNGDDVLPLAKAELHNAFVPNFKPEWVPNRMLDAYGRDVLAAGFDLLYFSLRTVVPVDFFLLFKAYVATLHAAFLTILLRYVHRGVVEAHPPASGVDDAVAWGFLAVVILGLLPWRNQTHFVAYQLAAVLCFVLLNEVTRALVAVLRRRDGDDVDALPHATDRYPALILLSFVCAFSLEAYAAVVLLSLLLPAALVIRAIRQARRTGRENDVAHARLLPFAVVLLAAITFCAIAVVVTLASSQRAEVTFGAAGVDLTGLRDSGLAWLSSRRGVIAVLLSALPIGIAGLLGWRTRGRRAQAPRVPERPAVRRRDAETWIYLSATAVVVIASVVVTIASSLKARFDYFSHASYPWGALLLVAKLFAAYAAALLALGMSRHRVALRGAVLLLAVMAASKGALDVLGSAYASHRASEQLHRIYRSVGVAGGVVTDSGLDLASIPMPVRPLPTKDSPEWFAAAYERLFAKYYGVSGRVVFE